MSSFARRAQRFACSQLIAKNHYKLHRNSLQRLEWRFCASSTSSNTTTTLNDGNNNTEIMNELKVMQKQLNTVHKNSKKSKWKYLFGILYFTPIAVFYGLLFNFWKSTKNEIMEQKNAYKVINIVISGIHSNTNPDFGSFLSDNTSSISFLKLKKCIDYACNDDKVLGISLIMDNGTEIGYASTQEIREELKRFKGQNKQKFITSYAKSVDMKEYLLSTICDEFYLMEPAILNIYGFSFPQLFFKNLLKKVGVKPYVLKREKYKNFADMFTEDEMSKEHKESLMSLGYDLYSQFLNILYKKLTTDHNDKYNDMEDVKNIVNNAPYISDEALKMGLITNTMQWKDYQMRLSHLGYQQIPTNNNINSDDGEEDPDILFLSPKEYLKSYEFAEQRKENKRTFLKFLTKSNNDDAPKKLNKIDGNQGSDTNEGENDEKHIALINISGEIRSGESEGTNCGSDTIEELIRSASASDNVIAILLRIDSPGGDAIASESIWNTVYDAKINGNKPIIVSMGDMCASGGYYIASAADKIYALPATITGSIGVVMMSLSLNELLTDKLNINYDQSIKFGDNSDIMVPFEYPNEKLQERYESMINSLYKIFMNRVSLGRDMTMDYVRNIAQGKVFTGQQALQIGLIDDLGGLREAQLACEELAGLPMGHHAKLVKYATKMEKFMDILDGFSDTASTSTKYKNHYITPILSQFNSLLKLKLWLNSFQNKLNDFQTMSHEPKPYYLCLDF